MDYLMKKARTFKPNAKSRYSGFGNKEVIDEIVGDNVDNLRVRTGGKKRIIAGGILEEGATEGIQSGISNAAIQNTLGLNTGLLSQPDGDIENAADTFGRYTNAI